ncbi:restriction endonuclease subunit S [Streptomyces sp. NA02950]|uniref:restriction endonuclease subunit S n=1 Tax=Streptomyces sp. NA02950 TaxID=2742137 RepID=UPI0015922653|nr:restriction endonuclease subunit S [Streptomyces sp. NA02950]QKV92451.1 restriction endonuclease subunit S [Streptomyces sp. NA02950]
MPKYERPRLGELCEIVPGPSGGLLEELSADIEDGVPVISPPDLTGHQAVDSSHIRRVSREKAGGLATRYRLREGDVILVRQSTTGLGRQALVTREQEGWLFATSCLRVAVTSDRLLPSYLLHYLGHAPVRRWLSNRANPGQAVETLTTANLAQLPVLLPDLESQRALAGALDEINAQLRMHDELSRRLGLLSRAVLTTQLGNAPLQVH